MFRSLKRGRIKLKQVLDKAIGSLHCILRSRWALVNSIEVERTVYSAMEKASGVPNLP